VVNLAQTGRQPLNYHKGRIETAITTQKAILRRESVMKTHDTLQTQPGMPMPALCARCDLPMKLETVNPTMFTQTLDDVVFRCPACGAKKKRTVRRG
jgi:hypothetical protein